MNDKPIVDSRDAEIEALRTRVAELEAAIRNAHRVKGRYHAQLAQCRLYDLVGLPNVKPDAEIKDSQP